MLELCNAIYEEMEKQFTIIEARCKKDKKRATQTKEDWLKTERRHTGNEREKMKAIRKEMRENKEAWTKESKQKKRKKREYRQNG